ncbi:MAG: SIS domain-containing protein [Thaumarchaeota archaeon]|nr:SIS domain-containing protein [Nitrososphaerota archaeon]
MCTVYDQWPDIAKQSYESDHEPVNFRDIDHIVFAGMGGSGAIGDVLTSILSRTNIHVCNIKGYTLPNTVDDKTLVITTSVSGNTRETLSILDIASKLDCHIVAFSSGGKIKEFCKRNKIDHRIIPQTHSPRASFPSFLFSMLKILDPILSIDKKDVAEAINNLEVVRRKIWSSNLTDDNTSLNLAEWITGIPVIYYPWGLKPAATRFKNSLQENAKLHSMVENVIEVCHNGIVAWEGKSTVQPILIEGSDDYITTKERWKVIKEYFDVNGIGYREVFADKGGIITKLVSLIYVLDYSTIYRAIMSNVDPTPIKSIDFIKEKLSHLQA